MSAATPALSVATLFQEREAQRRKDREAEERLQRNLQPGGFGFSARIINYPDGKPGDVGVFLTWPKNPSAV